VEGDIAVPAGVSGGSTQLLDSFIKDKKNHWPKGRVRYRIESDSWGGIEDPVFTDDQIGNITQALGKISNAVSCVRFELVPANFPGPHLIFTNMGDEQILPHSCTSYVGMISGNGQVVNLGAPACLTIGKILHETLHALGATHEMMREDRDKFVKILEENLTPNSKKNFDKKFGDEYNSHNTPFDYKSVMMYSPTDFGEKDGTTGKRKVTIETRSQEAELSGPETKTDLSLIDKVELALVYGCIDTLGKGDLVEYIHENRRSSAIRMDILGRENEKERTIMVDQLTELKGIVERLESRILTTEGGIVQLKGELHEQVDRIEQSVEKLSTKSAHCGYQNRWTSADSVITFNTVEVLGGVGSLVTGTGVYTAQAAGVYQVAWSVLNYLDSGKENWIYLHRNGRQKVDESEHFSSNDGGNKLIREQGGRTMLVNLQSGETLNLRTDKFDGDAWKISFCVNLVSPQ